LKTATLKIWPEIRKYIPALVTPISSEHQDSDSYFLEFQNTTRISSSGLTILLIQIVKTIKAQNDSITWETNRAAEEPFISKIAALNFFNVLNRYSQNYSFYKDEILTTINMNPINVEPKLLSFPIYEIDFQKYSKRRDALNDLKSWLYEALKDYYQEYDFLLPQLVSTVSEIAKNSSDHTKDNAFIGLDLYQSPSKDHIRIMFAIGDLGVGINQNIRDHLSEEKRKRLKYWDLTQTYREALQSGFTTLTSSKENKGLGMSLILDGAKGINLDLSVFDAKSRGFLDKIDSIIHEDIRKNFISIGKETGFFYYGEIKALKI
jgi:hypothetical protein